MALSVRTDNAAWGWAGLGWAGLGWAGLGLSVRTDNAAQQSTGEKKARHTGQCVGLGSGLGISWGEPPCLPQSTCA